MAGFTIAEAVAILDLRFPTSGGTDYIGVSIDGSTEWSGMTRTAVGATGWAAATSADPSVKATGTALTSPAATSATGAGGVTHFAIFSASSGGTQRTDWQALTTAQVLSIGGKLNFAVGAAAVTLT